MSSTQSLLRQYIREHHLSKEQEMDSVLEESLLNAYVVDINNNPEMYLADHSEPVKISTVVQGFAQTRGFCVWFVKTLGKQFPPVWPC